MSNEIDMNSYFAEYYRRSLYDFLIYFWDTIMPSQYIDAKHIKFQCDLIQYNFLYTLKNKEPWMYDWMLKCDETYQNEFSRLHEEKDPYTLIFNVPPGTSKSTIHSRMKNAWIWTVNKKYKVISTSYSAKLSNDLSAECRDLLLSNKYKELYPDMQLRYDSQNKSHYKNIHGGARITTSVGATIAGFHGDSADIDDANNPELAESIADQQQAITHVNQVFQRSGAGKKHEFKKTIVQQRTANNDVTAYILSIIPDAIHVCLPVEQSKDVKPDIANICYTNGLLDPERMDETFIQKTKQATFSGTYSAQYMQNPVNEGIGLFKPANMRHCNVENDVIQVGEKSVLLSKCFRFFTIDLAMKDGEKNDYSVYSYWACDKDYNLYLIDCLRLKSESINLMDIFRDFYNRYKPDKIGIEDKVSGTTLIQSQKDLKSRIVPLKPNRDKYTRALPAANLHERHSVFFNQSIQCLNDIENELLHFPHDTHDDFVDTFSYAVEFQENHMQTVPPVVSTVTEKESNDMDLKYYTKNLNKTGTFVGF